MATKFVPKHGSNAGYQAEQKTGQICDRCRTAHNLYNTQYTKKGKRAGLHYDHRAVIDHLAGKASYESRPNGRVRAEAQTDTRPAGARQESAQVQAEPGTGEAPFTLTAEPIRSLGDRVAEGLRRITVPEQSESQYITDTETPDYLHPIDPDPEPGEEWQGPKEEFVITSQSMEVIEENLGTYLSVVGMTLEMVDPYCGPVLAENIDNIVNRWSKVIARYPAAAKLFMAKGGGTIMDWIGAIQATWPVLYAIYEHHLAKTIVTDKGRVMRVHRSANGQGPTVDSTMPPTPDQFAYTVD